MKQYKDTPYFVDTEGNVYRNGKKLKGSMRNGYIRLDSSYNNKRIQYSIHRLVAELYIPNPENKPEVNHINGVKTDNRVDNLEWVSSTENMKHAYKLGLKKVLNGDSNGNSKLNEKQIAEIRQKYTPRKYSTYKLAKEYNVSQSVVFYIIKNIMWKHI